MSNVHPINPSLKLLNAPSLMRDLKGWLVWRYEPNPNGGKQLKVPYYVSGLARQGEQGSAEDRSRLTDFDTAKEIAIKRNYSGVGFCLMPEFNIVAGDFDNCVQGEPQDDDATVHPDVMTLVHGTYAEYSPSTNGVRAFWRGTSRGNMKDPHGKPFGFEVFSTKGFVTFTGAALHQTELVGCEDHVATVSDKLDAYIKSRLIDAPSKHDDTDPSDPASILSTYKPSTFTPASSATALLNTLNPDMSYPEWVKVGMALHHEYQASDDGFTLWDTWSSNGEKYTSEDDLRAKWDSFSSNPERYNVTFGTLRHMAAKATKTPVSALTQSKPDTDKPDPLEPFTVSEFAAQSIDIEWLIHNTLPVGNLSVLYGAPGSGKTFMAMDMCMAVASGTRWRNDSLKVKQGAVLYVACEGGAGLRKRFRGYAQQFNVNLDDIPLKVINASPNLLDAATVNNLLYHASQIDNLQLIVIDTLSRSLIGGDENSSQDLGAYLDNCLHLYRELDAGVLLVHHSGKSKAAGMRGHSMLQGTAYAVLECEYAAAGRSVFIEKQKDGEAGQKYPFQLFPVSLGVNRDGDEITTCVVQHMDQVTAPKMTKAGDAARQALCTAVEDGQSLKVDDLVSDILREKDKALKADGKAPMSENTKRKAKQRYKDGLLEVAETYPHAVKIEKDAAIILDESFFTI